MEEKLEAIIKHYEHTRYMGKTYGPYIVVSLRNGENPHYVLVSFTDSSHAGVMEQYEDEINFHEYVEMEVKGGGFLSIDMDSKKISVGGQSGSYGKADPDLVERILKTNFPGYNIKVEH